MNTKSVLMIFIVVLLIAASFYAGIKYQESKQSTFSRQFGGRFGADQSGARTGDQISGRNRMGARQTVGEIISQDDKSITVKLQDDSTRIVLFTGTTTVNKASEGSINDLKVGERVAVFGAENTDGSVIAQNIQLNPMSRGISGTPTPKQ